MLRSPQTYVSVDIEADGIAGCGSMLSIGAIGPHDEIFYSEICPTTEDYIPENRNFAESHGLERERLVRDAPKANEVMERFDKWVKKVSRNNKDKEPVFSAFNAAFDWSFVDLYFKKNGINNPFGVAPFDIKSQALCLDENCDWKSTKKDKLPEEIIPGEDFSHNALEDAIFQQTLLYGLTALTNKNEPNGDED